MGLVPVNKIRKQRWIIMGVIIVIVFIIGCFICLAIKRKLAQNAGEVDSVEREKQFVEFEKLFREQQDDLERLAEELLSSLEKKNYCIFFNEESYSGNYKNFIKFLYLDNTFQTEGNEDLVAILNENAALKEVLNSLIEKGVITNISGGMSGDMWVLELPIDTRFTPFITSNNGFTNAFHYCEEEGLERYAYNKRVEGNWYLWISPGPG